MSALDMSTGFEELVITVFSPSLVLRLQRPFTNHLPTPRGLCATLEVLSLPFATAALLDAYVIRESNSHLPLRRRACVHHTDDSPCWRGVCYVVAEKVAIVHVGLPPPRVCQQRQESNLGFRFRQNASDAQCLWCRASHAVTMARLSLRVAEMYLGRVLQ